MSQGRGSAIVLGIVVAVVALAVVFQAEVAEAAFYTVGDAGGWTFNVTGWPKGKRFRSGDTLVFNYISALHNVVAVDQKSYNGCITPARAKKYQTGKDQIRLARGKNFFICNFPGHCESGMKIVVVAA